jgi:hypothetical protein
MGLYIYIGVYTDYLTKNLSFDQLSRERKIQLTNITKLRQRPVIVYASDISKDYSQNIDYSDLNPFNDQLSIINGESVDIILETPGGDVEIVEDLVKMIRQKFDKVAVIVPGQAKSAGTIFTMAADEILMSNTSSLGPIDPQLSYNGKNFSVNAFLDNLNEICDEYNKKGSFNPIYFPILNNISPGEIQNAKNLQNFARTLVKNWLIKYKFKFWEKHSQSGYPVTIEEKEQRANEIASLLCDHSYWLTHARSIKLDDLRAMRLMITDYGDYPELYDAINRYYILLRMSFEGNIYKIFETATSHIIRNIINQFEDNNS